MNKWIKRSLGATAFLAALVAAAPFASTPLWAHKAQRHVDVQTEAIAAPQDAVALARGAYLFASRGCAHCHGANGAGRVFVDEPNGMHARSPNITPIAGSVTSHYAAADWVRTIRHGVKPDGTPVFIMPSEDYNRLTDADVGALVAWLQQLPPAPGPAAEFRLPTIVKLLYAAGVVKDAAEKIDHTLAPATPVAEAITPQHGAYVATMCMGCHGAHLSGGRIPSGPPNWPAAANLTPGDGSAMRRYPQADAFVAMLRSGLRPDGSAVSRVMPFDSLSALSDVDARALYLFLKDLPPRAAGNR